MSLRTLYVALGGVIVGVLMTLLVLRAGDRNKDNAYVQRVDVPDPVFMKQSADLAQSFDNNWKDATNFGFDQPATTTATAQSTIERPRGRRKRRDRARKIAPRDADVIPMPGALNDGPGDKPPRVPRPMRARLNRTAAGGVAPLVPRRGANIEVALEQRLAAMERAKQRMSADTPLRTEQPQQTTTAVTQAQPVTTTATVSPTATSIAGSSTVISYRAVAKRDPFSLVHSTEATARRFPLVRPNGAPGPAVPVPDDIYAPLGIQNVRDGPPVKAWNPRLTYDNTIDVIERWNFTEYADLVWSKMHPADEQIIPNAPASELYKYVDFSVADPVIEASHIKQTYENVEGSFDWCKANNYRCSNCTVSHVRPPGEHPCRTCTHCSAELRYVDTHPRGNPTFYAKLPGIQEEVVVKFLCIPGSTQGDVNRLCSLSKGKQPEDKLKRVVDLVRAITLVKETCGNFGNIAMPAWIAHVKAVDPKGGYVDQVGMYMRKSPGIPLETMGRRDPRIFNNRVLNLPNENVLLAALHDFIMCESDRHYGNIFYEESTNRILLIDNDNELGHRGALGSLNVMSEHETKCWANSLFLPGNLEHYRLRLLTPMPSLDYRCHVNDTRDIPLPQPVEKCLKTFASMPPEQLKIAFKLPENGMAESLHRRATNILKHGFERALLLESEDAFNVFSTKIESMTIFNEKTGPGAWYHRRGSFWRPYNDPYCPTSSQDATPRWPRMPKPWRGFPWAPDEQGDVEKIDVMQRMRAPRGGKPAGSRPASVVPPRTNTTTGAAAAVGSSSTGDTRRQGGAQSTSQAAVATTPKLGG